MGPRRWTEGFEGRAKADAAKAARWRPTVRATIVAVGAVYAATFVVRIATRSPTLDAAMFVLGTALGLGWLVWAWRNFRRWPG